MSYFYLTASIIFFLLFCAVSYDNNLIASRTVESIENNSGFPLTLLIEIFRGGISYSWSLYCIKTYDFKHKCTHRNSDKSSKKKKKIWCIRNWICYVIEYVPLIRGENFCFDSASIENEPSAVTAHVMVRNVFQRQACGSMYFKRYFCTATHALATPGPGHTQVEARDYSWTSFLYWNS